MLAAVVVAALSLWGASAGTAGATELCKTASSPCSGGTYGKGTTIEASLKAGTKWVFTADKARSCEEATIKAEVTGAGGTPGVPVTGTVTSMKLGKCSGVIEVAKTGTFSISSSAGSSILSFEGIEINAGGGVCLHGGSAAATLTPGAMASIGVKASLPKVGGTGSCPGSASWTAEFTVTAPEPIYVPTEPPATVLCKTASKPCALENVQGKGSTLKLELTKEPLFTFGSPSPYEGCSKVVVEGEITTLPGGGIDVGGPVKEFSFAGCIHAVSVLKKGTFSVDYTSGSNGTLSLKGFEVQDWWFCKWTGPAAFALTGGAVGSAVINANVPNNCGPGFTWTAALTVVKPEPLYVSEL